VKKISIQAAIKLLNEELGMSINSRYYTDIEKWRQWWMGYVKSFHTFKESTDVGKKKERKLYSMRMAKKICEDWASILLNEKTKIEVNDKNSQNFLIGDNGVLEKISFRSEANKLVEKAFYSGTGAFLMKLDNLSISGASPDATIRMEYLPAMCIVPLTVEYSEITEAAFVSEKMVQGNEYIYIEIHTKEKGKYVIKNRYYKKSEGVLTPVPLPDGIAEEVETGSPYPFFSVIKPNLVNPIPDNLGLGCAIYAQAIDNLKGVDIAYNNFNRDLWLGGKKVFYNRELTKTIGTDDKGSPIYITPDDMLQQLFVSVGDEFLDDKKLVQEFNPSLRVQDNKDAVQAQLDYLSFKCGMGTKQYQFSDTMRSAQITATQYAGEKQELKINAAKHGIVIEEALKKIIRAILWAGKNVLGEHVNPDAEINIEFSDGYIVSDDEKRAQDISDVRDGIMQPWEYREKWYGDDGETAKAILDTPTRTFGKNPYSSGEDGA